MSTLNKGIIIIIIIIIARLLLDAAGGLMLSLDNPFDFHAEI